jgi:hypothetical protein
MRLFQTGKAAKTLAKAAAKKGNKAKVEEEEADGEEAEEKAPEEVAGQSIARNYLTPRKNSGSRST